MYFKCKQAYLAMKYNFSEGKKGSEKNKKKDCDVQFSLRSMSLNSD